ncbi:PP2C family protein-serine/threonine phosphatase [candidate division KSB1 bacterium]|nr:PP2C family protein-serine/threonine phosphatase [candidate division KSB1 bacterium]
MVDPKTFYRDFDDLLKRITHDETGEGFVCSILEAVQDSFGESLRIVSMRLYEERGGEFVLINKFSQNGRVLAKRLPRESEAVQLVLKNGSYIFSEPQVSIDVGVSDQGEYAMPAAILIRSPEQRWIAVFELGAGWGREEVTFSLNAIRTALNFRLFSEAIKTELEQAAQIQRSLLPGQVPKVRGYEMAVRYQPTEIVGGDLYDFFEMGDEMFGVCIGDASGHGLPAALLVRDSVIGLRMGIERHLKMVHSLQKLNAVLCRSNYSSRFVSLFYCEIERDGHLIYANAGHPAPFVVKGNEVQDLNATGLLLGAIPEIKLHRSFANITPGAVVVLYSDGMFERENEKEEAFTIQRMKDLVIANQEKSAKEILDVVFDTVEKFGNSDKWEDDSTLLIIKRLAE